MANVFEAVPTIGSGSDLPSDIDVWISSPPMEALVRAFGGQSDLIAPDQSLLMRLDRLDSFTERWDTRQGKERDQADELALTPYQNELVFQAASALGFREIRAPRHLKYDHVLMLGGLFRACITRPAYAAELAHSGEGR